jgi:dTMP kinase
MGQGKRRAVNGVRRASAPSGDPAPGLFVVLEGIDGAGKSEQARRLAAWLRERGERVVETREPTNGVWGQRYRAWARGDVQAEPEEVLRFFVEDRCEHVARVIGPALEEAAIVVCDRYVASTLAYQAAQGLERDHVAKRMERERFPQPDLALWLRLPVAQALERLGPTAHERFERAAFLERVDAEYARLDLLELDASGSRDAVAQLIQKRVGELLR